MVGIRPLMSDGIFLLALNCDVKIFRFIIIMIVNLSK